LKLSLKIIVLMTVFILIGAYYFSNTLSEDRANIYVDDDFGTDYIIIQESIYYDPGDIIHTISSPGNNPLGLTWVNENLWNVNGHTIYYIDPIDGSFIYSIPSCTSDPYGLTWDGTHLWISDNSNNKICKVDSNTGNCLYTFDGPDSGPTGLAWDGNYLWCATSNCNIYKLDPTNGDIVDSFIYSGSIATGLTWDGNYLWISDYNNNKIDKINPINGDTLYSISSPGPNPTGLAWDGNYLWNADTNNREIYQIDVSDEHLPFFAYAGGPYYGFVDVPIQVFGEVYNGVEPYTWTWDDGNNNYYNVQNPIFNYNQTGEYHITLVVIDSENNQAFDMSTVYINEDNIIPIVEIHKPINVIYINDQEIVPFFTPLIFGNIQIWPYAIDNESGISQLDLFIDDVLKKSFPAVPYSWTWDIFSFGKHTIKLVAYDGVENSASTELDVWKFF
jgi:DNA-binding beta-propeller fold protein YncE